MERTKQGGSILGYVIVGGVLVVLLLAGAYALRNYWSGTKPAQVAEAPNNSSKQPSQPQSSDANKDKDKNQGSSSSNSSNQPAQPSATPAPAAPATPAPSASSPTTTQLPQTGPADTDTLLSLMILAILMTSAGIYLHSRRLDPSL